jgi:hypothetical protein
VLRDRDQIGTIEGDGHAVSRAFVNRPMFC